jgi:hypothetical protein
MTRSFAGSRKASGKWKRSSFAVAAETAEQLSGRDADAGRLGHQGAQIDGDGRTGGSGAGHGAR